MFRDAGNRWPQDDRVGNRVRTPDISLELRRRQKRLLRLIRMSQGPRHPFLPVIFDSTGRKAQRSKSPRAMRFVSLRNQADGNTPGPDALRCRDLGWLRERF
jgi:hypothetical protein